MGDDFDLTETKLTPVSRQSTSPGGTGTYRTFCLLGCLLVTAGTGPARGVFLGVGNETFASDTVETSTGNGVYINTSNSSYPAYPETISHDTLDKNARFGSNTVVEEGSLPSVISGNVVLCQW